MSSALRGYWLPFDQVPYAELYALQKRLVDARIQDAIPDTLLLGEHPHVITLGRKTALENLLKTDDMPVFEIERGGDVTYHGPGQLVGYPIFQLQPGEQDLHRYLRNLEEVLIRVLSHFDVNGTRKPEWTGVWVGERKIASIGVAVRKWVTYHGFALNVTTDLTYFQRLHPCGLPSSVMTSLQAECPEAAESILNIAAIQELVISEIEAVFGRSLVLESQNTIIL